jgi:hypothetical protein
MMIYGNSPFSKGGKGDLNQIVNPPTDWLGIYLVSNSSNGMWFFLNHLEI